MKLNVLVNKDCLNKEDKINIKTLVNGITRSTKYSREELNYQVLVGILKMLKCDEDIHDDEVNFLKKWLSYYSLPENVDKDSLITDISK